MAAPPTAIGELRFLYVGTDSTEACVAFYVGVLGARLRWRFQAFDADVAAVELGEGPLIMLADHRPTASVLRIYAVESLDATIASVVDCGGAIASGPSGTPEGDVVIVVDPSGTELAFLQVDRPGAMDRAYADGSNSNAVRP